MRFKSQIKQPPYTTRGVTWLHAWLYQQCQLPCLPGTWKSPTAKHCCVKYHEYTLWPASRQSTYARLSVQVQCSFCCIRCPHGLLKLHTELFLHSHESRITELFTSHSKSPCVQAFAQGTRLSTRAQETDWPRTLFKHWLMFHHENTPLLHLGESERKSGSYHCLSPRLLVSAEINRIILAAWETKSLRIVCVKAGHRDSHAGCCVS